MRLYKTQYSFRISGNRGYDSNRVRCLKSSVKFPQSVMIWGAMSSAGVGPLCFKLILKSLSSAHEKWGQKQKCCIYNFFQYMKVATKYIFYFRNMFD